MNDEVKTNAFYSSFIVPASSLSYSMIGVDSEAGLPPVSAPRIVPVWSM
jgi:hypothetical protein